MEVEPPETCCDIAFTMKAQKGRKSSNTLPPKDARIFEGSMSRTVITAKNGKRLQTRYACLTDDRLIFSKSHQDSVESQYMPELEISTNELWAVFDEVDVNKDGYQPSCSCFLCFKESSKSMMIATSLKKHIHPRISMSRRLDPKESAEAITKLGLFTTKEAFDKLFSRLDQDESGDLEWEVCVGLSYREEDDIDVST